MAAVLAAVVEHLGHAPYSVHVARARAEFVENLLGADNENLERIGAAGMECGKASRLFAGGGDGDDYHVGRFFAVDILVGNLSDHRGAGHRCARRPCRVTPVAGIVTEPCQRVGRCFGGDCLDAARFRDVPHPGLGRGACELKGRVGGGEVKSAPLKRKAAGVVHCQGVESRAADGA